METQEELIAKFKSYLEFGNAGTARTYTPFIRDFLGFLSARKLSPEKTTSLEIAPWFRHLEKDKGYSKRTINVGGSAVRRFFKAIGHPEIASMIPTLSIDEVTEAKWLPEPTAFKLIGKIPPLCVAYDLALRIGEVPKIRAETFNRKTGEIQVIREKHKARANKYQLTLDPWCREILEEHLRQQNIKQGPIFPFSVMTINTIFRQRRLLCQLDETYKFHGLRHSRITHIAMHELEQKGTVDIVSLAKFAGHARLEVTLNYIHLAAKYLGFREGKEKSPTASLNMPEDWAIDRKTHIS